MSGIKFKNNKIAYNINSYINGAKYVIDEVAIRDLSLINDDMIIGLRFLQYSTKGLMVTEQGIAFIPHNEDMPYATKINKKLNMQSKWDPSTSHDTSKQNISTPYEFLTPKISFKTEQTLSCFTQDIKDLIWKKYTERQHNKFKNIQKYFMNLYIEKNKHQGISIDTHIFHLIHFDDKLITKAHHKYLILRADINLKHCRSIYISPNENISLQGLIDHGLVHAIYGSLQQIIFSDLGKAIKEACTTQDE